MLNLDWPPSRIRDVVRISPGDPAGEKAAEELSGPESFASVKTGGRIVKSALVLALGFVIIPGLLLTLLSCSAKPPKTGLIDGQLRACPGTPNCVSSEDPDVSARVAPLTFQGPPETAWKNLKETLRDLGGNIREEQGDYLWATFTSRIFRFVDDVEFRMVAAKKIIHVRSASRVGHSDLGVNRKRVEKLRAGFTQKKALKD